jgi:hypothetical protein
LRLGPLTATGPIVEESLWGVACALIVYLSGTDAPLALLAGGPDSPVLIVALGIALCGDTPWSAGRIAGDGPA